MLWNVWPKPQKNGKKQVFLDQSEFPCPPTKKLRVDIYMQLEGLFSFRKRVMNFESIDIDVNISFFEKIKIAFNIVES